MVQLPSSLHEGVLFVLALLALGLSLVLMLGFERMMARRAKRDTIARQRQRRLEYLDKYVGLKNKPTPEVDEWTEFRNRIEESRNDFE